MRRVGPREFAQEMRARGLAPRALGSYGEGNPNVLGPSVGYNEREVFRGEATSAGPGGILAEPMPIPVIRNRIVFNLIPFAYQTTDGSRNLLPANEMRAFLCVQNQSTASFMYVNFSNEAAVNVGIELYPAQAIIYDTVVPYNSINIFVSAGSAQLGVVVEGALQL